MKKQLCIVSIVCVALSMVGCVSGYNPAFDSSGNLVSVAREQPNLFQRFVGGAWDVGRVAITSGEKTLISDSVHGEFAPQIQTAFPAPTPQPCHSMAVGQQALAPSQPPQVLMSNGNGLAPQSFVNPYTEIYNGLPVRNDSQYHVSLYRKVGNKKGALMELDPDGASMLDGQVSVDSPMAVEVVFTDVTTKKVVATQANIVPVARGRQVLHIGFDVATKKMKLEFAD